MRLLPLLLIAAAACAGSEEAPPAPGAGGEGGGGAGGAGGTCVPSEEVCNGRDDDCDRIADEDQPDLVCDGEFRCGLTGPSCVQGRRRSCRDLVADADVCGNGLDDDCDGLSDCDDADCAEPRTVLDEGVYGGSAVALDAGGWLLGVAGPEPFTGEPGVAWIVRVASRGRASRPLRIDGQLRARLLRGRDGTNWLATSGLEGAAVRLVGDDGSVLATYPVAGRGANLSGAAIEPHGDYLALLLTWRTARESTFVRLDRTGARAGTDVEINDPATRFATLATTSTGTFVVRTSAEKVVVQRIARDGSVSARDLDAPPDHRIAAAPVEPGGTLLLVIGATALHVDAEGQVLSRTELPAELSSDAGAAIYPFGAGYIVVAPVSPGAGRSEIVGARLADPAAEPGPLEHLGPGETPLLVEPAGAGARVFAASFTGGVTLVDTQYCESPRP